MKMFISSIRIDGGTQMRAEINEEAVADLRRGVPQRGPVPAGGGDLRRGTKGDAVLFTAGANSANGLRRTNE